MKVRDYKTDKMVIIDLVTGIDIVEVYRGDFDNIPEKLLSRDVLCKTIMDDRVRLKAKTTYRR